MFFKIARDLLPYTVVYFEKILEGRHEIGFFQMKETTSNTKLTVI